MSDGPDGWSDHNPYSASSQSPRSQRSSQPLTSHQRRMLSEFNPQAASFIPTSRSETPDTQKSTRRRGDNSSVGEGRVKPPRQRADERAAKTPFTPPPPPGPDSLSSGGGWGASPPSPRPSGPTSPVAAAEPIQIHPPSSRRVRKTNRHDSMDDTRSGHVESTERVENDPRAPTRSSRRSTRPPSEAEPVQPGPAVSRRSRKVPESTPNTASPLAEEHTLAEAPSAARAASPAPSTEYNSPKHVLPSRLARASSPAPSLPSSVEHPSAYPPEVVRAVYPVPSVEDNSIKAVPLPQLVRPVSRPPSVGDNATNWTTHNVPKPPPTSPVLEQTSQVPTWDGPPTHRTTGYDGNPSRVVNNEANMIVVPHPRVWGRPPSDDGRFNDAVEQVASQPPKLSAEVVASAAADEDAWSAPNSLQRWAQKVPPIAPPETPPTPVPANGEDADDESSAVSRPNSGPRQPKPITVFYVETDSSVQAFSPKLPDGLLDGQQDEALEEHQRPRKSGDNDEPEHHSSRAISAAPVDSPEVAIHSPLPAKVSPGSSLFNISPPGSEVAYPPTPDHAGPHWRPPSRTSRTSRSQNNTGHWRVPPAPFDADPHLSQTQHWYKKEGHPMWNPAFTSRRFTVFTPFTIRTPVFVNLMKQHFGTYGRIRLVNPLSDRPNPEGVDRGVVVFHDESSVEKMKADPKHQVARYQSTTRSPFADIDLQIMHHRPNSEFIRVSVKVVGRRHDARSRSASPALAHGDSRSYQTLPPSVTVWAMPVIVPRKNGEGLVYRAAAITDERKDDVFQQCKWKSGKDPIYLRHFDLGRRVAEKDFIPALVEFFTDVQHIDPPGPDHDSWVFSVAAVWEARLVIEFVPGIFATVIPPPRQDEPQQAAGLDTSSVADPEPEPQEQTAKEDEVATASPPTPVTAPPVVETPRLPTIEPPLSHITKHTLLSYRGRPLREQMVNGRPYYFDDAALFAGGLANQETVHTLLQRFGEYGKILSVEMNQWSEGSTYGSGRILFQDVQAAKTAIECEHGAVSFGSVLRVETRKVVPESVETLDVFIDSTGRVLSPSMISQYGQYRRQLDPPPGQQTPQPPPAPTSYPMSYPHGFMPQQPWIPPSLPAMYFPASASMENQEARSVLMPFVWPFGFYPTMAMPQQPVATIPTNTTQDTPAQSLGVTITPPDATTPSAAEMAPQVSIGTPVGGSSVGPVTVPQPPPPVRTQTPASDKIKPRVIEAKFADGVFTPVYHPGDMQQWREENGIVEQELKLVAPPTPQAVEALPLLPIATGGHDSAASHSQSSSYYDGPFPPPPQKSYPQRYPPGPRMGANERGSIGHRPARFNQSAFPEPSDAEWPLTSPPNTTIPMPIPQFEPRYDSNMRGAHVGPPYGQFGQQRNSRGANHRRNEDRQARPQQGHYSQLPDRPPPMEQHHAHHVAESHHRPESPPNQPRSRSQPSNAQPSDDPAGGW